MTLLKVEQKVFSPTVFFFQVTAGQSNLREFSSANHPTTVVIRKATSQISKGINKNHIEKCSFHPGCLGFSRIILPTYIQFIPFHIWIPINLPL